MRKPFAATQTPSPLCVSRHAGCAAWAQQLLAPPPPFIVILKKGRLLRPCFFNGTAQWARR